MHPGPGAVAPFMPRSSRNNQGNSVCYEDGNAQRLLETHKEATMYQRLWNPARVRGYPAAVLLSCLALFWGGCAKDQQMPTSPLNKLSLASLSMARNLAGGGVSLALPSLGSTSSFAVLGGSTVTSTGLSVLTGDLGVSPGTAITGFGPGVVNGTIHAGDAVAAQAQSDLTTAYNALAGLACDTELTGQDLGGKTLAPGVYCFSSSAQLTGALVLDARGDPNAVFVFQIASTLTTGTNASVAMINGGSACNVFWQVGSSATLGTGTAFVGSILAYASITLTTGVSLSGRALARTGAVTMDTNTVSAGDCGGQTTGTGCKTKVTGGGSIRAAGGLATFGFVVQQNKDGRVKGQLQYVNHASGTRVHMRAFTSLLIVGKTATFAGSGTINRLPGSFTVTVTDEGEPGRNDRFSISISGGPTEEGALRGGNIQIHEKDCGEGDGDDEGHHGDNKGHDGDDKHHGDHEDDE